MFPAAFAMPVSPNPTMVKFVPAAGSPLLRHTGVSGTMLLYVRPGAMLGCGRCFRD